MLTLNVSASTGCANAKSGLATFTKELRNFFNIRVFSDSVITDFSRLFNIFSVAILIISRAARPATKVVVVAKAGTMRPAICSQVEERSGGLFDESRRRRVYNMLCVEEK